MALPAGILIAAGLLALAGVALLLLGRRGRRINDNLICKRCGFDLEQIFPPGRRWHALRACPECGRGLGDVRRVGRGVRAPDRVLIRTGCVLLALAAVPPAIEATRRLPVFQAAPTVNIPALLNAAASADPRRAGPALEELAGLIATGQLGRAQAANLTEQAWARFEGPDQGWLPAWGRVLEAASRAGTLSPSRQLRYLSNLLADASLAADPPAPDGSVLVTLRVNPRRGADNWPGQPFALWLSINPPDPAAPLASLYQLSPQAEPLSTDQPTPPASTLIVPRRDDGSSLIVMRFTPATESAKPAEPGAEPDANAAHPIAEGIAQRPERLPPASTPTIAFTLHARQGRSPDGQRLAERTLRVSMPPLVSATESPARQATTAPSSPAAREPSVPWPGEPSRRGQ
jgi:hypothetical protein